MKCKQLHVCKQIVWKYKIQVYRFLVLVKAFATPSIIKLNMWNKAQTSSNRLNNG